MDQLKNDNCHLKGKLEMIVHINHLMEEKIESLEVKVENLKEHKKQQKEKIEELELQNHCIGNSF